MPVKVQSSKIKTSDFSHKFLPRKFKAVHTTFVNKRDIFLARRPHRSFKKTYRRDYVRSLRLPGYWAFTRYVAVCLRKYWKTYAGLAIIFTFINSVFVGLSSQQAYSDITNFLTETGKGLFSGQFSELGQSGLLLVSGLIGAFSPRLSDVQQIYAVLFGLMLWLTTVWLLREQLRERTPKLLNGIYRSGSPIIPTAIVFLIATIQFVPLALAVLAINVGIQTGIVADGGLVSMLLWIVAALLGVLSLYWTTSTFIAMVVVTLPGMRPLEAIRTSGDLVIGRRLRILYRLLWLILLMVLSAILIILPVILFDRWFDDIVPAIAWIPIVPLTISLFSSAAAVYVAAYVYLLYRKVVDDDASPA